MMLATQLPTFELPDYLVEALDAIQHREAGGMRRQLVVLPTGTGKTVVFAPCDDPTEDS